MRNAAETGVERKRPGREPVKDPEVQETPWNGAFVLLDDCDVWYALQSFGDHFGEVIAESPTRDECMEQAMLVVGEMLDSYVGQRRFLKSSYEERNIVRRLGAKFDEEFRQWYVPEERSEQPFRMHLFRGWERQKGRYAQIVRRNVTAAKTVEEVVALSVPYLQAQEAKKAGAAWSPLHKAWVVSKKGPFRHLIDWLPKDFHPEPEAYVLDPEDRGLPRLLAVGPDEDIRAKLMGAVFSHTLKAWMVQPELYDPEVHGEWEYRPKVFHGPRLSFALALCKAGFNPFDPKNMEPFLFDGNFHRFFAKGDSERSGSGRYRGFITTEGVRALTGYVNVYTEPKPYYAPWKYKISGLEWDRFVNRPMSQTFFDVLQRRWARSEERRLALLEKKRSERKIPGFTEMKKGPRHIASVLEDGWIPPDDI